MVAGLAILLTLLLGLLALAMFLIWKSRQQTLHSYKPVDETVPEQELPTL